MEENDTCAICQNFLSTGEVVKVTKGLNTLFTSSISRNDGLHDKFKDISYVVVHVNCRKNYTRKSFIKKVSNSCINISEASTSRSSTRTKESLFAFKRDCLFCGEEASSMIEMKKSKKYRRKVHQVATLELKNSITRLAEQRNDEWGQMILTRVNSVLDLVAAECRYHNYCFSKFRTPVSSLKIGRPIDDRRREAFEKICANIEISDECQYSLMDIYEQMKKSPGGDEIYTTKQLKNLFKSKYGDRVTFTGGSAGLDKEVIMTFKDSFNKLLYQSWCHNSESEEEGRLRIVSMAAKIIKEDIQSQIYDCKTYPPSNDFYVKEESLIPKSLNLFLAEITAIKNKKTENSARKRTVIAHSIISACRPRSFISPIHLGLGVYCLRHYASKQLIDILSSLGVSVTYSEVRRYEYSRISSEPLPITTENFVQFAFDNADFNTRTLDGFHTFHSRGGIKICTPPEFVNKDIRISRVISIPKAETLVAMAKTDISTYKKPSSSGLNNIKIKDILQLNALSNPNLHEAMLTNDIWLSMHILKQSSTLSWNGFMHVINANKNKYDISQIVAVPFINMPASDLNTIYSALLYARKECKKHNQETCIVSFDQPLYIKATEMIASAEANSEITNIVVKLGGFHLLMSFLGTIGHIMSGSGLEELWSLIYAKNTTVHMLNGHAYSRALRAHFLTYIAVNLIIWKEHENLDTEVTNNLRNNFQELIKQQLSVAELEDTEEMQKFLQLLNALLTKTEELSRTAKLWIQYLNQVRLIMLYIRAERTGDWQLHLYSVKSMLPYFHAAGHLHYAKSAHLYVQQMEDLKYKMNSVEYEKYTSSGYFTIRRQDSFWSGIWTDMVIEQSLMRTMKISGGLTQGRGITDSTLARWILTFPISMEVSEAFESFCGKYSSSSEQHVALRDSRKVRDAQDIESLFEWLNLHNPFIPSPTENQMVNVATGLIADEKCNCDNAKEIGTKAMTKMIDCTFGSVKLKRKDKVLPISATNNTIIVRNEPTVINPLQLFSRITCVLKSHEDFSQYLKFELAPVPPSLFDEVSMRKTTKSTLSEIIKTLAPCVTTPTNLIYVIDGGYLLHAVTWCNSVTYDELCMNYDYFILNRFSSSTTVVFDGYTSATCTKHVERQRRTQFKMSAFIAFENNMKATTNQAEFLRNSMNKARLIDMLKPYLISAGITVLQDEADADTLIASTAINLITQKKSVAVVGTDTDLLIILIARSPPFSSMFFFTTKNQRGKGEMF